MAARRFAMEVVRRLQDAGYQALWAGGCVRDQALGRTPKDYDVATSALPDEVRSVFGKNRTLPIGAAFGVITVLGPKNAGVIEVATFRKDGDYSDGRRPDHVEFTDDREDALRRDFTINGMFFDPIAETVIDYVGGKDDLKARRICAIGNPHERISEDKLRMLRGVRFASTLGFELEPETMKAIQKHACQIDSVSGERIGHELRRMLGGPHPDTAARLLRQSGLLAEILTDGKSLYANESAWEQTMAAIERLKRNSQGCFESVAVVLLETIFENHGIEAVSNRWKLSNDERKAMGWICKHWQTLNRADELKWSEVQPLLLNPSIRLGLAVATSKTTETSKGIDLCHRRLDWPVEKLNPRPLLDGSDLIAMGIKPGPRFKLILDAIRTGQLDGEIETIDQAMEMARR